MSHDKPDSLLTVEPPQFGHDDAARIAAERFGVSGHASPLWSERDQNFRISTDNGEQFVLKIANSIEDPRVIDFQTRALQHISRADPALPVPRVIENLEGREYCRVADADGRNHMVRLITWLDGLVIAESEASENLLGEIGATLAKLGRALKDFHHEASGHVLLWDLKNAADLLNLLQYIDEPGLRGQLEAALNRFADHVVPVMNRLRWQIIHADLNRGNVLISEDEPRRVTGIIDFGDMVHTPLIMDLAIAASYHLGEQGDPLGKAPAFIGGYHRVTPLEPLELELLPDLMLARLCTSITVNMWRAKLYPQNAEYLLIHNRQVRATLQHALSFPREELIGRIGERFA